MKPLGIIANPASGKDIRRIISYGLVFGNIEKINIIKRILKALESFGARDVYIMPDYSGLGLQAINDVDFKLNACILKMDIKGNQDDSTQAAKIMNKLGVGCIITLGGDGTNRVVAKACDETPILPISTGTNNVFPSMIEGTLAGMAAAVLVNNESILNEVCQQKPRLDVYINNKLLDIALIDVVVTDDSFIGSKAVWKTHSIREVILVHARPAGIGFSALGGCLDPLPIDTKIGLHIVIGPGNKKVKIPIAPGLISWFPIASHRTFDPNENITIKNRTGVLVLDGEREIRLTAKDELSVRINLKGPLIIDSEKALTIAARKGLFIDNQH